MPIERTMLDDARAAVEDLAVICHAALGGEFYDARETNPAEFRAGQAMASAGVVAEALSSAVANGVDVGAAIGLLLTANDRNGVLTGQEESLNRIERAGRALQEVCHGDAVKAGWWHDLATGDPVKVNVAEKLCLIHSEVSEAMEGNRKCLQDDKLPHRTMLEVELADAVIRCMDLAGGLGLDLGGAIAEKLEFNRSRADHKPEARRAAGGKAY